MKPVATGFPDDDLPDFGESSGEPPRFLSSDARNEIAQLLQHIGRQETVVGCVVIGHDGLLIANSLPPSFDPKLIGQLALDIYMCTSAAVSKLGHDHLHQFVGKTSCGYVVLADFGGGLLVLIKDDNTTETLIPVMRGISQLVAR